MKKIKLIIMLVAIAMMLFACKAPDSKAATSNGVSITVPSQMDVSFNEDGTTSVSGMYLENDSIVPVEIRSIDISECNDWVVVGKGEKIPVNTKNLSIQMGQRVLSSGSNNIDQEVAENARYDFDIQVTRGAWTYDVVSEKALEIEVKYEIGTKEFVLILDKNGGGGNSTMYVRNGSTISLTTPTREGYAFVGWEDESGNVYKGTYTMPIGDVTLKAVWKELIAYAIYSTDDHSLRFVKSAEKVEAGDVYNGRVVTSVYSGFEKSKYSAYGDIPWYADGTNEKVKTVIVEDKIKPISMENWFYRFEYCSYFDMTKVDTSEVTSLHETFHFAGRLVEGAFKIVGLENWDVSKVTNFSYLFEYAAVFATSFDVGDLGGWDVSSATTLTCMFATSGYRASVYRIGDLSNWNTANVEFMGVTFGEAGAQADWHLDCSRWNVRKVRSYTMFNKDVENKVIPPKWVY